MFVPLAGTRLRAPGGHHLVGRQVVVADLRRVSVRFSERELNVVVMALMLGQSTLIEGDTLSLAQKRDLARAISKVLDAEKRLVSPVVFEVESGQAGDE